MSANASKNGDAHHNEFALLTAQIPPNEPVPVPVSWGHVFADTTVAAAMLDRLLHRSVVFNITGDSYRLREHQARNRQLSKGDNHT